MNMLCKLVDILIGDHIPTLFVGQNVNCNCHLVSPGSVIDDSIIIILCGKLHLGT